MIRSIRITCLLGWGLGDVVSKTEPPKEAKWRVRENGSSRTSHPKDQQTGSGMPGLQRACCFPSEYSHKTVRCNNIENMFKQIRTFIFICVCKCLVTKEYFPLQPLWAALFFFLNQLWNFQLEQAACFCFTVTSHRAFNPGVARTELTYPMHPRL